MKNILFFVLILLIGCTSRVEEDVDIMKSGDLAKSYDEKLSRLTNPYDYEGELKFIQGSNSLVGYSTGSEDTHYFIVKGNYESFKDSRYKVSFLDHLLILKNEDTKKIDILGVDREESKTIFSNIVNHYHLRNAKLVKTKWLVHFWLKTDELKGSVEDIAKKIADQNDYQSVFTENIANSGCSSGGPGSNSCSTSIAGSGCSVSCSSGFYACCSNGSTFSMASCYCVKNPKVINPN